MTIDYARPTAPTLDAPIRSVEQGTAGGPSAGHRDGDRQHGRAERPINVSPVERTASALIGGALLLFAPGGGALTRAASRIAGGTLLVRGVTGKCAMYRALGVDTADRGHAGLLTAGAPLEVQRSITIGKSPEEVYRFWRDPKNVQRIMAHFAELTQTDGTVHWRVQGPANVTLEWDTQLVEDNPGRFLRWESMAKGSVDYDGSVAFSPAPEGMGTVVTLRCRFDVSSALLAPALKALEFVPKAMLGQALRRCKSLMEAGEIPTTAQNPAARHDGQGR